MLVSEETLYQLGSSDIATAFLDLQLLGDYAYRSKTLQELFDNHTRFISHFNEWKKMFSIFKTIDEDDYINYMQHLEKTNPNIFNNLHLTGISFDPECEYTSDFIKAQAKDGVTFPFAELEIVGWDAKNFIIRDTIYYEMTGKHGIFFLSRLDKAGDPLLNLLKQRKEKL